MKTRYIKSNVTKQWLLAHNFHYNKAFNDDGSDAYSFRFPVCKYKEYTTLECELTIVLGSEDVMINVYDYGTRDIYPAFYNVEYGNYDEILKTIWTNINCKLQEFGIKPARSSKQQNGVIDKDGDKDKKNRRKCDNANKRRSTRTNL